MATNRNYRPTKSNPFNSGSSKRTSTQKKSSAKKTEEKPKLNANVNHFSMTLGKGENERNLSVRPIENGYIVRESGSRGKGEKRQWYEKERFSPKMPDVNSLAKGKFKF